MSNKSVVFCATFIFLSPLCYCENSQDTHFTVADEVIKEQRAKLKKSTKGLGFGPQSPRDIDWHKGKNLRVFSEAPHASKMNVCNIHFHKNAEHKGGEFTQYAGNGDGYIYTGKLDAQERKPYKTDVCSGKHGVLDSGDTIEVHYVHSSADVKPGPTLGACVSKEIANPQLRVETQVYVLVNDRDALDFNVLAKVEWQDDKWQAINIPNNTGKAIQYQGSTTGPSYNEKGSPYQVSWSVRPNVAKVDIGTLATWCKGNDFGEGHAHGVRNLVVNPDLLSQIY